MSKGEAELYRILDEKVDLLLQTRQTGEALRVAEKATAMARRTYPAHDTRRARALRKMGVLLADAHRPQDALECFEDALESCRAATEFGMPNSGLFAKLHAHAGFVCDQLADENRARFHYEQASIFDSESSALEPATAAIIHNNLAVLYKKEARDDLAENHYLAALKAYETALGPDHLDVAVLLANIGNFYMHAEALDLAERMHERALQIRLAHLKHPHADVAWSKAHLALVYHLQGKSVHAEPLYVEAFETWEAAGVPSDSSSFTNAAHNYLQLLRNDGRNRDAAKFEKHLRKVAG